MGQFSFAEEYEGWCDFSKYDFKKNIIKCKKGDIIITKSDKVAAMACEFDTLKGTGGALHGGDMFCKYRGSLREGRFDK